MNQKQFLISHAEASGHVELIIRFADGQRFLVNLKQLIARNPSLARLRDPTTFQTVRPDDWNRGVVFDGDDELTLASDNLRAMAIEQSGGFSHQQLIAWMDHHGMTLDAAADALDVSRRMLAYYRSGSKPIPRTVGLAMLGWDIYSARGSEHAFAYDAAA